MTYSTTKFKVATSNGLGGDTFTRNVTDGRTHGRTDGRTDGRTNFDTKLIYPFFLKKKAGLTMNLSISLNLTEKMDDGQPLTWTCISHHDEADTTIQTV